jgi:hypothetical protein
MKTPPKYPHKKHWERLKEVDSQGLEPEEFLQRWRVTHADLAKICRVSKVTVDRWFSHGNDRRTPRAEHKSRLFYIHREWIRVSFEEM